MKSRLILIDGIPGSGKSTTANYIHRQLLRSSIEARWFHELEESNPLFDVEYIQTRTINDAEDYVKKTLEKWRILVKEINKTNQVYIIESYLLQATVGCMFDNNINQSIIQDYASRVPDIISELNPVIIYFSPQDVRENLLNLRNVRDNEWIESRGESLSKSKYAVARKLEGFEGWVSMLSARAHLSNEILQSYEFPTLVIDATNGEWDKYYDEITKFLGIERTSERHLSETDLERIPGQYRLDNSTFECSIVRENDELYLHDFFPSRRRLLEIGGEYEIEGVASTMKVDQEESQMVKRMSIDMTRLFEGEIFRFERV
ncbi:MAG: hypothetical protein ACFFF4_11045 [Candidatus Thorarchaeota archaeon]